MIAEQIKARCPLENIAWQGGMVKTIPPSLVPTEGRNTGHEYSVVPQNPLLNKGLASNGFGRTQFVMAMYKQNQSKVTNFREKAKSRTFVLELNIINIFRPCFLIYSLLFQTYIQFRMPQYSRRNMIISLRNLSPGCTEWLDLLLCIIRHTAIYELHYSLAGESRYLKTTN